MNPQVSRLLPCFLCVLLQVLILPATVRAQFYYTTNGGTITITGTDLGGDLIIPSTVDGLPVTGIRFWSGLWNNPLNSITIPGTVTRIEPFVANAALESLTAFIVDPANPNYS